MKKLILLSAIIILTACDNRSGSSEISNDQITTRCLNGIEYYLYHEEEAVGYKGYGYMAPKYNPDGAISKCYSNPNGQ